MKLAGILFVLLLSVQGFAQEVKMDSTESTSIATETKKSEVVDFVKKVDLAGDLRYRYQAIKQANNQERRVNRIMFRVGQNIQVQEDLKITYRLLTGTSATSGNVTLGDSKAPGSSRQSIGLDLAYGTYTPITDLSLFIGKMQQYFYFPGKNQLILDRDLTPEGVGLQYKLSLIDDLSATINLGSFWVREKYDDALGEDLTDSFMSVAQLNLNYKLDDFQFLVGYGLFTYTDIKGDKPASFVAGATSSKGNTLDALGRYKFNYEIAQAYGEVKWVMKPMEISLFGEFDQNTAADDLSRASVYGVTFSRDRLAISFMQQKIEKDAVMGAFTDSDFADGQTSSQGNIASISYKLNKNAAVAYTHYFSQMPIDTTSTNYDRSHVDLTLSF